MNQTKQKQITNIYFNETKGIRHIQIDGHISHSDACSALASNGFNENNNTVMLTYKG